MRYPLARPLLATALCAGPLCAPARLVAQAPRTTPAPALLVAGHVAGLADRRTSEALTGSGFGPAAEALPYLVIDLVGARGRTRWGLEVGVLWQPSSHNGREGRTQQLGAYTFTATYGRAIGAVAGGALIPTVGIGGTHRYTRLRGGSGSADRTSWSAYLENPGRSSTLHASTLSTDLGVRWLVRGPAMRGGASLLRELRAGYRVPVWGDRPSVAGQELANGPRARTAMWYAGLGIGIGGTP